MARLINISMTAKDVLLELQDDYESILGPELFSRRAEQDDQWGGPTHDDTHDDGEWTMLIGKFVRRASMTGPTEKFEDNLLHIAALAIAAIQSSRRKRGAA